MNLSEIENLVKEGEGQSLEYKETTGQRVEACRTLCAFLNGQGGTVVFGVTHKGRLAGQFIADTTKRDLFDAFQAFEPAADVEVEYVQVDKTHSAIVCRVERGNCRPYVYDGKPYKRVQSSTTAMGQEEYEKMLVERGGFRSDWERQENPRLTIDEIDLEEVKKTARMAVQVGRLDSEVDVDDAVSLLKKFKVMHGNRLLNAAAVLFGNESMIDYPQCAVKMARFRGTGKNEFGDERREEGNIFALLSAATQFCFKHLNLSAKVIPARIERDEHLEIPPEALREAILNALVHRQYSKKGAVSLAIYDDRLEVTSPGGFPPGKTVEQIMTEHESEPRNERIAHVLYLRKTIETWGRGFDRIRSECEKVGIPPPKVVEKDGYVRLTFLRRDEVRQERGKVGKKSGQEKRKVGKKPHGLEVGKKMDSRTRYGVRIRAMFDLVLPTLRSDARSNMIDTLAAIAAEPSASIIELAGITGLPRGTVRNAQEMLKELGFLYRVGGDRGGHWLVSWKDGK